jgi:hypothetical protein
MPLPEAATTYYQDQQRTSLSTVLLARRLWAKLGRGGDFDAAWRTLGPQLLVAMTAGQRAAATQAVAYVPRVLEELGIDPAADARMRPAALAGVASDGRPLASLLYQPVVATRTLLGRGASLAESLSGGGKLLDEIVSTQVVDAGRAAESVASTVRPAVGGYVRMLSLPSCDRCVVLAGRFYRFNVGFDRHPNCDCRHVPASEDVAGDLTTDVAGAIASGQVGRRDAKTGKFRPSLSEADRRAISDGADPYKVINAKRGMSTEQVFNQRMKVTTEGTSRRAGNRMVTTRIDGRTVKVRPRPESIYQMADGNRTESLRLLRLYGYVL